ncbi:MAG: hypothetical protein ACR2IK_14165 [Chloroflexota bacterium]
MFTAGEQELQWLRGVQQAPTRCPVCVRRRTPPLGWHHCAHAAQPGHPQADAVRKVSAQSSSSTEGPHLA